MVGERIGKKKAPAGGDLRGQECFQGGGEIQPMSQERIHCEAKQIGCVPISPIHATRDCLLPNKGSIFILARESFMG